MSTWWQTIFRDLPRQLCTDRTLWLATALFWGIFFATMALAATSPAFVEEVLGDQVKGFEQNFSSGLGGRGSNTDALMAGFYIQHNTTIGLQCFAYGLILGVGGLFVTAFNAAYIGAVFGHMLTTPQRDNFLTFVTAHGPCELTAIVLCAAAGLRLGFSLIRTGGLSREASLRAAGKQALPTIGVAVVLFFCAAMIEGFLSSSSAPFWIRALVASVTAPMIFSYIVVLGISAERRPMQLDKTCIVIRERGWLDILDLSLGMFRTHGRQMLVALAAGAIPLALLNYWLLTRALETNLLEEDPGWYWFWQVVLALVEIPLCHGSLDDVPGAIAVRLPARSTVDRPQLFSQPAATVDLSGVAAGDFGVCGRAVSQRDHPAGAQSALGPAARPDLDAAAERGPARRNRRRHVLAPAGHAGSRRGRWSRP